MAGIYLEFKLLIQNDASPYLKACVGTGSFMESVVFHIGTAMKFYECYKAIIDTLCNFDNWSNPQFFDKCNFSDDELYTFYTSTYPKTAPTSIYTPWTAADDFCSSVIATPETISLL